MSANHWIAVAVTVVVGWQGASAHADVVPPSEWDQMKSVGYNGQLTYQLDVPSDVPLTVTCQYQPSGHIPGSYDAGFVSPGWLRVRQSGTVAYEGNVIMEMRKPYGSTYDPSHAQVLIGDEGRGVFVGNYVPGMLYTITMVWDRGAGTIDITVASAGGGTLQRVVNSSNQPITNLEFIGPNDPSVGTSMFGNVQVITPEPCVADVAEPFGTLDIDDVLTFLNAFAAGEALADVAPPTGSFDIDDVLTFLAAFGAGCP